MMLSFTNSNILGVALTISVSGILVTSFIIGVNGVKKNKVLLLSIFLALAGLFYALIIGRIQSIRDLEK